MKPHRGGFSLQHGHLPSAANKTEGPGYLNWGEKVAISEFPFSWDQAQMIKFSLAAAEHLPPCSAAEGFPFSIILEKLGFNLF